MPTPGSFQINEIIRDYGKRLQSFIRQRVKRVEDADDILQDVYTRLAEADRMMKPIDELASWLFTVARNRITDSYRKKKPDPLPYYSDEEEEFFAEIGQILYDNGSTPETDYLRQIFWDELEKALTALPNEQREIFELTELQGFAFKEISEEKDIPVNTLISRKRYAILHLREWFREFYTEFLQS